MIQAIMLIALGFLIASLIGVLLAPSLWSRASRLSKKRLEGTLPLTLAEIEATQDHLRATYAVRVRRLESALAGTKQKAANQLVDNSRLQMQIVALKDQIADLDLQLSERRNAATVLEQTIIKRFPELDREITAVKAQLQERAFELQDLTSRLARRDEELAAAQDAAASYQEELQRLHQVLEKSAADRSGRRVRRASQWDIEDYRAEYDRLNLELSKLRQQLTLFQDRDSQQVGVIKGELQRLAELILTSAQPKGAKQEAEQPDFSTKRFSGQDSRRERPVPWRENAQQPIPLAARLKLNAEAPARTPRLALPQPEEAAEGPVLTAAPTNGHAEVGGRPKILQEVVVVEPARQTVDEALAGTGTPPVGLTRNGADIEQDAASAFPDRAGTAKPRPRNGASEEAVSVSKASNGRGKPEQEGPKALSGSEAAEIVEGNGAHRAPHKNGDKAEDQTEALNIDELRPDPETDKIGPHQPTLLERLRGVGEEASEGGKTPSLPRA